MSSVRLELDVADLQTWEKLRADVTQHGGLVVPTSPGEAPAAHADVEVVVMHGGAARGSAVGRVVQPVADGVAVLFEAAGRDALLGVSLEPEAEDPAETSRLAQRFETLSKAEKIRLARTGNADVRRRILRDPDQSLHVFLLGNPGLAANEVAGWFRSGFVPRELIEQIAKRTELASNVAVMEAIVQDPRTQIPTALRLLPKIPLETCRRIAKAGKLRSAVVSAARKRVLGP